MNLPKKPYSYFAIFTGILIVLSVFFTGPFNKSGNSLIIPRDTLLALNNERLEYGLPADSFDVVKGTIRKNTFFTELLMEFDISSEIVSKIEKSAQGIFDIHKIKAGNPFAFFRSKSDQKIKYVVYQNSPVEYYVMDLTDSVTVEKKEKSIETHHKTVSGIISSSLWDAMVEQQINPAVAIQLSEIFAWSIDFFGLQRGDAFKIMYDEQVVDSASVGIGTIHGAWFHHAGQEYSAIPYKQDGVLSFYDNDGNSLRKAFLKAPLKFSRISSHFSNNRFHPVLKIFRPHHGVDYAAPIGTPVHAIGDGMVTEAGWEGGAGRMIKIRHNSMYTTGYMHLNAFAGGIHPGTRVKQGDLIGYVGSSGLSSGPHLDFRVWQNNEPINPLTIESPPVEPIKQENRNSFNTVRETVLSQLNKISMPETASGKAALLALNKRCVDREDVNRE
jgi:murein DD-endopeptidase MepM/ murein hydrolase activator NlpD